MMIGQIIKNKKSFNGNTLCGRAKLFLEVFKWEPPCQGQDNSLLSFLSLWPPPTPLQEKKIHTLAIDTGYLCTVVGETLLLDPNALVTGYREIKLRQSFLPSS